MTVTFEPTKWVTSSTRALQDYAQDLLSDDFDVIMSFPDTTKMQKEVPFTRTIIHFEQDDHENPKMGFGDLQLSRTYDLDAGTIAGEEAQIHVLTFDLGVWASEASGGGTSRMVALQGLSDAFCGPGARRDCMVRTQGVEILDFHGGRNMIDTINDLPVWRALNMSLRVRVFGKKLVPPIGYIASQDQDPVIDVEDQVILPDAP